MTKQILYLIILFLVSNTNPVFGQRSDKSKHFELGIDLAPTIANLINRPNGYFERQVMFKVPLEKGYIRLQCKAYRIGNGLYNNFSYYELITPGNRILAITNSFTVGLPSYGILGGYTHKIPLRKKNKKKKREFYAGLDAGIGIHRAYIYTRFETDDSNTATTYPSGFQSALFYPTAGVKFPISKRLFLSLEMNIAFEYTFGNWEEYIGGSKQRTIPGLLNGWNRTDSWLEKVKLSNIYLTYAF